MIHKSYMTAKKTLWKAYTGKKDKGKYYSRIRISRGE